jgi:photosystem II stability/assembly factor-like uncharacterized protein
MKKLIIVFLIFILPLTSIYSQWIIQYNQGDAYLTSLQFFNENTGNIFGWNSGLYSGGYFYKTTNGGTNWDSMPMPSYMSTIYLEKQSFINASTGYVCGFSNKIFKTTNGGVSWSYSLAPYSTMGNQSYNAIQFLNEQTGYIGGRFGIRAKTTNGGNNWITLDTALEQILSIDFIDVNYGFMGDTWSDVYKTTDGGLTWSYKYLKDSLSNEYTYNEIKFINYNTGFMIGSNLDGGVLFKTTNGGNNWKDILIYQNNNSFNSLFILDGSIFYIGCSSQGLILKSTNGGINWSNQYLPNPSPYIGTFFVNSNIGYATSAGHIYKTTNGGVFIKKISSEVPNEYNLYQNYPNPFNPSTNIKYQITNNKHIILKVFDASGKEIATLVNEKQSPGTYEVSFSGGNLSSGIYFYSLNADGKNIDTKKLVLLK